MRLHNCSSKQLVLAMACSLLAHNGCFKYFVCADTSLIDFGLAPLAPDLVEIDEDSDDKKDCKSSEEMKISSLCSSESEDSHEPSAMPLANGMPSFLNDPMGIKEPILGALLDDAGNPIPLDMALSGNFNPFDMPINSNVFPPGTGATGLMIDDPFELPARVVNLGVPTNLRPPIPPADLLYDVDVGGGVPLVVRKDDPLASLFARLDLQMNQHMQPANSPPSSATSTVPSVPLLLDIVKRDKPFL